MTTANILRAEQSRAEQSRAEQSRAEQSRAEQSRAEVGGVLPNFGGYALHLNRIVYRIVYKNAFIAAG